MTVWSGITILWSPSCCKKNNQEMHHYPGNPKYIIMKSLITSTHLNIIQSVAHIVQTDVITHGIDSMNVWRQQLRSPEIPPHPGRAPFQAQNGVGESAAAVGPDGLLTLPSGPWLLLIRVVYWVDTKRVAQVGVRVAGLGVRQRLVRGGEVRRLEVRAGGVREGRLRAVEVLAHRGNVR